MKAYRRETASQIAQRIREGKPARPLFVSEAKNVEGAIVISSIGVGR